MSGRLPKRRAEDQPSILSAFAKKRVATNPAREGHESVDGSPESPAEDLVSRTRYKVSERQRVVQLTPFCPETALGTISEGLKSKIFLGWRAPRPP